MGALALLLTGCSSGSGSTSDTKPTYVIATTNDLSASLAVLAVPYVSGLRTYINFINAKGGVNGHKLSLNVLDDGGNPDRGVTNTKQLLQDKPVAFLAHVGSAVQLPQQKLLDDAKVPTMAYVAVEQLLPSPEYFATGISSTDNYMIEGRYIQTQVGASKPTVAFFYINTPAQKVAAAAAQAAVQKLGWTVVASEVYESNATEVSAQAQKIAAAKPDFIIDGMLDNVAPTVFKTFTQLGITVPIVNWASGSSDATFKAIASNQFVGLRTFAAPSDPTLNDDMVAAMKTYNTTKDATSSIFTQGWVTGMVYAKAIEACGDTCTGESVTAALQKVTNLSIQDLGPAMTYTATNHQGTQSAKVFKWDASKGAAVPSGDYLSATDLHA